MAQKLLTEEYASYEETPKDEALIYHSNRVETFTERQVSGSQTQSIPDLQLYSALLIVSESYSISQNTITMPLFLSHL